MSGAERQVAVVIIRTPDGRLFAHRRRPDRAVFPNGYGLGAGGKVEPGEDAAAAAVRELREETGLAGVPKFLFRMPYSDSHVSHTMYVYEFVVGGQYLPNNDDEWSWSGWVTRADVDRLLIERRLSPDTAELYQRYQNQFRPGRSRLSQLAERV